MRKGIKLPWKTFWWQSGRPKRCPRCMSKIIVEGVWDSLDVGVGCGIPMEIEYLCSSCGKSCAYWAHGYFEPFYIMDYAEIPYD